MDRHRNILTFLVKQHHIRTNNINREQQNSKTLRNKQLIGLKWTNAKYWNLYEPTSIRRSKIWTLFPHWWSSCCRRVWVLTEAFLLTEPSTHLDPWTQLHPCRIASFAWVLPSLRLEKNVQMCISKPYLRFVFRSKWVFVAVDVSTVWSRQCRLPRFQKGKNLF